MPDLTIAKSGPTSATVGQAYDYTITVTNSGTAATTATATVSDSVPAGLTINSAAGCTISGQDVSCDIAAGLAAGATASFTINVTPEASVSGTTVSNTASVSGGGDPDCTSGCDSTPVDTVINAPDLTIAKSGPTSAT
ncbi:isopeptide-forming domain-containing fimbrial protein, partial [Lampropedia cohaerens]|uniref:isopeptide-forming domain-containing fimbrial protein n=1 Tax=Lampropedia cohaerens TaxID=1610491 RepID=UPI0018D25153